MVNVTPNRLNGRLSLRPERLGDAHEPVLALLKVLVEEGSGVKVRMIHGAFLPSPNLVAGITPVLMRLAMSERPRRTR